MFRLSRRAAAALAGALALLLLYPLLGEALFGAQAIFLLQKLSSILILAILALSLELLVGFTGLVSLGHALFFGLAGYALALLAPSTGAISLWWALPATLALTAGAALAIGALALRTAGVYFIMTTLAFGQMGFYLFNDAQFAGGSDGLFLAAAPRVALNGVALFDLGAPRPFYYAALIATTATFLLLLRLLRSPFGRALQGIRDNQRRMEALGCNVYRCKLIAFTLAGTLAGLAGFLHAAQFGFVSPDLLEWRQSGLALVVVIVGGAGTLFGPLLGAFFFEWLQYGLEAWSAHWRLPLGLAIIAFVLLLPRGIAGWLLKGRQSG